MMTAKKLSTGYWLLRGSGPCEWAQVPHWPCSPETLEEHTFLEASGEFRAEARLAAEMLLAGGPAPGEKP